MKVTKNFDSSEFDCKDGTKYPKEWIKDKLKPLCQILEKVREKFGKPIKITSGYRTLSHNRKVGGSKTSTHLQGIAADFVISGVSTKQIFAFLDELQKNGEIPKGGLHAYKTFVHIDTRGRNARW